MVAAEDAGAFPRIFHFLRARTRRPRNAGLPTRAGMPGECLLRVLRLSFVGLSPAAADPERLVSARPRHGLNLNATRRLSSVRQYEPASSFKIPPWVSRR